MISSLCNIGFRILGTGWILVIQPGTGGELARMKTPAGVECVVSQRWNGWDNGGEPYTVWMTSRTPDGESRWHYIDHEASRWPGAALSYDAATDTITVKSAGREMRRLPLRDGVLQTAPPPASPR